MKYKGAKKQHISQKMAEVMNHRNKRDRKVRERKSGLSPQEAQQTFLKTSANRPMPGFTAIHKTQAKLSVSYGFK